VLTYYNKLVVRWGIVSPFPNLQAGRPPLVGCLWLLIQYIHNHPPNKKRRYFWAIKSYSILFLVISHSPSYFVERAKLIRAGFWLREKRFRNSFKGIMWPSPLLSYWILWFHLIKNKVSESGFGLLHQLLKALTNGKMHFRAWKD